jgi:hypothetical protein
VAKVRTVAGWIWLVVPLLLLVAHIWMSVRQEFISLSYYAVVWGSLLALSLCGFWFVIDGPGAKWLLRAAATVVALYVILMFLISSGNAPFYGGHNYFLYAYMAAGVAFCVFTFYVAGRRAT